MKRNPWQRLRAAWHAEFLSPKDLMRRAVVLGLLFAAAHVSGLREFTSVLNGTTGSVALSWETAAFLGVLYVLAYLGVVVLAPILLLAAAVSLTWRKLGPSKDEARTRPAP